SRFANDAANVLYVPSIWKSAPWSSAPAAARVTLPLHVPPGVHVRAGTHGNLAVQSTSAVPCATGAACAVPGRATASAPASPMSTAIRRNLDDIGPPPRLRARHPTRSPERSDRVERTAREARGRGLSKPRHAGFRQPTGRRSGLAAVVRAGA